MFIKFICSYRMTTWGAHFESSGPTKEGGLPSVQVGLLKAPAQEPRLYRDIYIYIYIYMAVSILFLFQNRRPGQGFGYGRNHFDLFDSPEAR